MCSTIRFAFCRTNATQAESFLGMEKQTDRQTDRPRVPHLKYVHLKQD